MARVVLRRYLDFVGAQLDRTRLEGAGIRAEAVDSAGFLPLTGIAGGVTLEVDEADVERAEALLADHGIADEEVADDPEDVRCPRCELEYTQFRKRPLPVGAVFAPIVVLFAVLLRPFEKKRWYCLKCEHAWDDSKAGPRRMTALPAGIPKPVFRLRRGHPGSGLFLGWLAGLGPSVGAAQLAKPLGYLAIGLFFLFPYVGLRIGRRMTSDVCSEPTCRAPLPPGIKTCPSCKGAIVGIVRRASEHFVEAAAFRREMAAAAKADVGERPASTGKDSKPRRKRKAPSDPTARVYEPPADT